VHSRGKGLLSKDLTSEIFSTLKKNDLRKGASLMVDYKGKTYPVIFEAFAGNKDLLAKCLASNPGSLSGGGGEQLLALGLF
jgi:hypothetical protein